VTSISIWFAPGLRNFSTRSLKGAAQTVPA
jgi:hypothetical protein